jgi:hypothetical protein
LFLDTGDVKIKVTSFISKVVCDKRQTNITKIVIMYPNEFKIYESVEGLVE